ncbi:hypothetical protein DFH07DRAFT_768277 [Mycena maculata]|uniref:MYND-type domain-containing protein n=1 Tax=Mycena maculata TaxID=230809 RepID=A0AAD7JVC4_9AGAR|nr:hypothetical protein DFH07DRAFT_768277 [Mycena maculata]
MSLNHAALMLPLVFVRLEPTGIPSSQELDAILCTPARHDELHRVRAATVALNLLARLIDMRIVPEGTYVDLWPRLYPWILFVHSYFDVIPSRFLAIAENQAYSVYSTIILPIGHHPTTSAVVQPAPGLRLILASWWATILDNNGIITHKGVVIQPDGWNEMYSLLVFISGNVQNARHFEEILDGVGGMQNLVSLLLKHLDMALARPPSTVTIGTIVVALKLVDFRRDGEGTPESAVYASWKAFEVFVVHRLAGLDYFESGNWISSKACENMQASQSPRSPIPGAYTVQCLKMATKSQFQKCSKWGVPYYCSKECQKADWIKGHKAACQDTQTRKSFRPREILSPRERSFIRAFMQHNFLFAGLLPEVLGRQLQFMYAHPGVPFFTVFDYTRITRRGWIDIFPVSDYDIGSDALVRFAQMPTSGQRLQLHLVLGRGGWTPWVIMFPVWSSSSKHRGQRRWHLS